MPNSVRSRMQRVTLALVVLLPFSTVAHAYVGPGLGLGALGAIIGTVVAVVLAFFGLLWYPIKRMLKKRSGDGPANDRPDSGSTGESD